MMDKDFGEFLIEMRVITPEQLSYAQRVQEQTRQPSLARVLVDLGYITAIEAVHAQAAIRGLEFVDLARFDIDPAAINVMPPHIATRDMGLPLQRQDDVLVAATAHPGDSFAEDDIRLCSGRMVRWVVALPEQIEEGIARHCGNPYA